MANYIPFVLIPFIAWGVWRSLERKNQLTSLKKRTFTIAIVAFFLTEVGRSFYRPYIYSNDINDYFVADTIGNSLGTVTAIFMVLTLAGSGTPRDWKIVGIITLGLVAYEGFNLLGDHPFDANDVLATLCWGALSAIAYARILAKHRHSPGGDEAVQRPERRTNSEEV
jgi:hypothetical protein